ncbi:glycosyltransferase family 4 protein [Hymenobacter rigui]|uniref:Glycosyltransferase n=1 Tax=Hymenobacter rigui TaxID=334424 RepID=A0A3R9P2X8_9BACT|nr:glycosyltransferase [Hymenobacter rigui]RSK43105.1 glycosyltransferase [Hymenobacter rigui]
METRVLITAYAVNPYKGSEDATGWNFLLQAARHQLVVAVTRRNNRPDIERYLQAHPELAARAARIEFRYFDLPAWCRWWKKGPLLSVLYFYMWQLSLALWLCWRRPAVDVVHSLNFHSDWTPSFLWLLGRPLVWGPVGHHPAIPHNHLTRHGRRAYLRDRLLWTMKRGFWRFDPFLCLTRRRAGHVLCVNSTVAPVLGLSGRQSSLMPAVAVELPRLPPAPAAPVDEFVVMIAGRMVPLKGFDMVITAFARFYHALSPQEQSSCRLQLIGSGPEEARLHQLLQRHGLEHCARHQAWLPREQVLASYAQASVFFFPSHEGAGMVVPEALSYGVPVLCYANAGPGELVPPASGLKVRYGSFTRNADEFAAHLTALLRNPGLRAAEATLARRHVAAHHTWNRRGEQLRDIYTHVLAS